MPKRDYDGEAVISESGNWNVAAEFSKFKIMMPLAKCDVYEDIAKFGYESLGEELMNYGVPTEMLRYNGLKRLINELLKLCKNSKFALKKGNTKADMKEFEEMLNKLESTLPLLIKIRCNHKTKHKVVKLEEDKFSAILNVVLEVKSQINEPLNKNHLIFTDKEEFDPIAFKERFKHRMIHQG